MLVNTKRQFRWKPVTTEAIEKWPLLCTCSFAPVTQTIINNALMKQKIRPEASQSMANSSPQQDITVHVEALSWDCQIESLTTGGSVDHSNIDQGNDKWSESIEGSDFFPGPEAPLFFSLAWKREGVVGWKMVLAHIRQQKQWKRFLPAFSLELQDCWRETDWNQKWWWGLSSKSLPAINFHVGKPSGIYNVSYVIIAMLKFSLLIEESELPHTIFFNKLTCNLKKEHHQ